MNTQQNNITIERKPNPFYLRTQRLIVYTGPKKEVLDMANDYCSKYAYGYMPSIQSQRELENGEYRVVINEFVSCE